MNSMARIRTPSTEDASRLGYGVEDMDISNVDGDLPISTSVLVDINGVLQSSTVFMGFLIGIALSYSHVVYIHLVSLNALLSLHHTSGQPPRTPPWRGRGSFQFCSR